MAQVIVFWLFQIINGFTAIAMVFGPKRFHESLFKDPELVYQKIGFSQTAIEMLHNIIRGQGAALLAITAFSFYSGPQSRETFLLIAFTCTFSLVAHVLTARHHLRSSIVMQALGSTTAMYPILILNFIFAVLATLLFFKLA